MIWLSHTDTMSTHGRPVLPASAVGWRCHVLHGCCICGCPLKLTWQVYLKLLVRSSLTRQVMYHIENLHSYQTWYVHPIYASMCAVGQSNHKARGGQIPEVRWPLTTVTLIQASLWCIHPFSDMNTHKHTHTLLTHTHTTTLVPWLLLLDTDNRTKGRLLP